jgi:hypothetical protein
MSAGCFFLFSFFHSSCYVKHVEGEEMMNFLRHWYHETHTKWLHQTTNCFGKAFPTFFKLLQLKWGPGDGQLWGTYSEDIDKGCNIRACQAIQQLAQAQKGLHDIVTFHHPPALLRSVHIWPFCWLQSLPCQISWLNTPLCMWAPNKLFESLHFSVSCNSLLCNLRCFVTA